MSATRDAPVGERSEGSEHLTIISADCHAGGSHAQYREYLDPAYLQDFDDWRGRYKNPFRDLGDHRRLRNWDSDMRNCQQEADGVVAEVLFPNTVPPFFPSFVLFAPPPPPDDVRAPPGRDPCAQSLAGGLVQRVPGATCRASARSSSTMWTTPWPTSGGYKEHGLRGGILLPNLPPDVTWVKPLHDPCYEPLWTSVRRARGPCPLPRWHRLPQLRHPARCPNCCTWPRSPSIRSGRSCTCCSRGSSNDTPGSSSS